MVPRLQKSDSRIRKLDLGWAAYLGVSLGVVAFVSNASLAGVTAFSSQQEWEAELTSKGFNPETETFDSLSIPSMTPLNGPHDIIVAENRFFPSLSISVLGQDRNADDAFIADGQFHGELFPDSGHTAYVHDFTQSIIAFGQNYTNPASGRGLRLSSSEGVIDIFDDSELSGFDDGFFGFIADEPITSVEVIASDGSTSGEIFNALDVSFAQFPLIVPDTSGDYNRDGVIDAVDYAVWREALGTTGLSPGFSADGNRDRSITEADFQIWVDNYEGILSASGAISEDFSQIPEPAGALMIAVTLALGYPRRFENQ